MFQIDEKTTEEGLNTYVKYAPNVFIAKCEKEHKKGDKITVNTKYNKMHICIVYNLMGTKTQDEHEYFYYSIVRGDGYNRAQARADKYKKWEESRKKKSDAYYNRAGKDAEFLRLGEPIKIGHHSEKRHRKMIEQRDDNLRQSVESYEKAKEHKLKAEYWESKADEINLSMPESLEYFQHELKKAQDKHAGLENGTIEREHGFSLTYAKKEVNKLKKLVESAIKLWGDTNENI